MARRLGEGGEIRGSRGLEMDAGQTVLSLSRTEALTCPGLVLLDGELPTPSGAFT